MSILGVLPCLAGVYSLLLPKSTVSFWLSSTFGDFHYLVFAIYFLLNKLYSIKGPLKYYCIDKIAPFRAAPATWEEHAVISEAIYSTCTVMV